MNRRPKPLPNLTSREDCHNAFLHLRRRFGALWADVGGAEMAEWTVVVAFVLASGLAIYNHILTSELSAAVDTIGNHILDVASGNLGAT
jgi:hypothetical protein